MGYAELVTALQEEDHARINRLLKEITPRLIRFLQIHMGASKQDAEDCAQDSILLVLDVIQKDKLNNPDKVLSYLLTTCRNSYLKTRENKKEVNYEHIPSSEFHEPNQIERLVEEDRKKILEYCLNQLKSSYRRFIEYWFANADSDARKVAEHFDISVNNVWTRKHRIIKELNECYQKKNEI